MAALSPRDILDIITAAYELWKKCDAAPEQYSLISMDVYGTATILELVHDGLITQKGSIVNQPSSIGRQKRNKLQKLIEHCKNGLTKLQALMKKYEGMSSALSWAALKWGLGGKDDVMEVQAYLSSAVTQLSTFISILGWASLSPVEAAVDRDPKNPGAAARKAMGGRQASRKETEVLERYATKICEERNRRDEKPRGRTPDPPKQNDNLAPPTNVGGKGRPRSADPLGSRDRRGSNASSSASSSASSNKKPALKRNSHLECWRIRRARAAFGGFEALKREQQKRGQYQLSQMADQFRAAYFASRDPNTPNDPDAISKSDGRIQSLLNDKRNGEKDSEYEWVFVAARIEKRDQEHHGLVKEEQVMCIVKRQMTKIAVEALARKEAEKERKRREEKKNKDKAEKKRKDDATKKGKTETENKMKDEAEKKNAAALPNPTGDLKKDAQALKQAQHAKAKIVVPGGT